MASEIERRFLVPHTSLSNLRPVLVNGVRIRQTYLSRVPAIRVRILESNPPRSFLTVKFGDGLVRQEFEYEIPLEDAEAMERCDDAVGIIHKTRYTFDLNTFPFNTTDRIHPWEIDVFEGHLEGLVIAEIELVSASFKIEIPAPFGKEITGDPAYSNAALAKKVEKKGNSWYTSYP